MLPSSGEGKKVKVKLSRNSYAGAKGERKFSSYSFATSALDGVSGQRHAPAVLYSLCPQERIISTHCTGGWVGLRAGLDTETRGKIRIQISPLRTVDRCYH
jgi:hypothetical protein